mmetsp:Transcript_27123/g.70279  ORF Transcript_27123/g.70279 Transcript_27123/m.70279 type:complete len:251 (+) Transcript_27123:1463-2215(+)
MSRGQVPCQSPSPTSASAPSRRCTTRVSPSATATIRGGFPVSRSRCQWTASFKHLSTRWIRSFLPSELCSMYRSSPFPVSSTAFGSACFRRRNCTTRIEPVLAASSSSEQPEKSRLDGLGLWYTALSSFMSFSISMVAFSDKTRHCWRGDRPFSSRASRSTGNGGGLAPLCPFFPFGTGNTAAQASAGLPVTRASWSAIVAAQGLGILGPMSPSGANAAVDAVSNVAGHVTPKCFSTRAQSKVSRPDASW